MFFHSTHKIRRPHKANLDMAGKILTWRENSAASQRKRAWNAPWNAPSPPRIFSCRHDNVMTTRDKNEFLDFTYAGGLGFIKVLESPVLILIADKNSAKENGKQIVWRAIANEWPVMLISLLLCAISGICVWALVSQALI